MATTKRKSSSTDTARIQPDCGDEKSWLEQQPAFFQLAQIAITSGKGVSEYPLAESHIRRTLPGDDTVCVFTAEEWAVLKRLDLLTPSGRFSNSKVQQFLLTKGMDLAMVSKWTARQIMVAMKDATAIPATPPSPQLDPKKLTVTLPGQAPIPLTEQQYRVVSRLIEANGGLLNGGALREYPKSSERIDYIIKGRNAKGGLPEPIRTHIKADGPKGYRWCA